LFQSGAVANAGGFSSKTNDALIEKTLTSGESQAMYNWEDYLANQLPMMWQPNGAYSLTEVSNNLRGVIPQSPTLSINPENWYFVK
jgi:peptide/nickel transport system substrate-binding protein